MIGYRDRIIRALARRMMRKYEPGVIAVTGETGQLLQERAVGKILRNVRDIRMESRAFGESMALPVTVLSENRRGEGAWFWLRMIADAWWRTIVRHPYPELLVVGCRARSHDDAARFLEIARPQITVVTGSDDAASYRAAPLVEALPSNGYGIMDCDGKGAAILAKYTRAHVTTFGFAEGAAMRITNFKMDAEGVSFALEYGGKTALMQISGARSKNVASAAAGAACVGIAFGMNLQRIASFLRDLETGEESIAAE